MTVGSCCSARRVGAIEKSGSHTVALWRPGQKSLAVAKLPVRDERNGSTDSFAVLK